MWIGCGIYWVWIVLVDMLKRRWSISYTLINLGKAASQKVTSQTKNPDSPCCLYQATGRIRIDCICVAFCICGFVCKWLHIPALYSRLGFSVSVTITLLVDCYSISICHNFHFSFSWAVWWPKCIFISSWSNFDGLTANLVLPNSIIYVQLSSNGTESTSGHWALCCLWVRVMFISSICVNLYIRPCILVCAFL